MNDYEDRFERLEEKIENVRAEIVSLFKNGPISKLCVEQAEQRAVLNIMKAVLAAIGMTTLGLAADAIVRLIYK